LLTILLPQEAAQNLFIFDFLPSGRQSSIFRASHHHPLAIWPDHGIAANVLRRDAFCCGDSACCVPFCMFRRWLEAQRESFRQLCAIGDLVSWGSLQA
jgi:hypothetical protein